MALRIIFGNESKSYAIEMALVGLKAATAWGGTVGCVKSPKQARLTNPDAILARGRPVVPGNPAPRFGACYRSG